jgi:hypothetical protein
LVGFAWPTPAEKSLQVIGTTGSFTYSDQGGHSSEEVGVDRLSLGEKVLGASGLLLFLSSFMGFWIKAEIEFGGEGITERGNAWDGYGILLKLGLVCALAAAILVIARAANANLSLPWSNVYKGLAATTLICVVVQLLIGPEEVEGLAGVEISRGIGLIIGTLLAAAMAAGAFMHAEAPGSTAAAPDTATT